MLRKNAKIELLRRVPLFEDCSKAELARIAAVADELSLPADRELTREGEHGREFVVLVEGTAEVRREGKVINRLGDGDFLGEIALVADVPRTATVTTTWPSRVLVVTDRAFRSLMRDSPSLQSKVLTALARRVPPEFQ
ncbi:MAG TPA: cyclic nucleotide-binding domain-containing protein [Gaiellaceae bacterium]|jgi:CRP-like cAMP-binding protein|nr:cyclic nucleotide-binding domain-containing protein [Gaiellaceae bacterium]